MGRKPLKKKAMTDAERQARRRKKVRDEKLKTGRKAEAQKKLLKAATQYVPCPPGITYYEEITAKLEDGTFRKVWVPKQRPLATVDWRELSDADLEELIATATERLRRRRAGLPEMSGAGVGVYGVEDVPKELLEQVNDLGDPLKRE